jgi:hypothetical protein
LASRVSIAPARAWPRGRPARPGRVRAPTPLLRVLGRTDGGAGRRPERLTGRRRAPRRHGGGGARRRGGPGRAGCRRLRGLNELTRTGDGPGGYGRRNFGSTAGAVGMGPISGVRRQRGGGPVAWEGRGGGVESSRVRTVSSHGKCRCRDTDAAPAAVGLWYGDGPQEGGRRRSVRRVVCWCQARLTLGGGEQGGGRSSVEPDA